MTRWPTRMLSKSTRCPASEQRRGRDAVSRTCFYTDCGWLRAWVTCSAANRLIGEVVQSRRRPILKCENGSSRFQPGEGPSRGLLRDYEPSDGTF